MAHLPVRYTRLVHHWADPPRYTRIYGSLEELRQRREALLEILRDSGAPDVILQALVVVEREGHPPFLFCPTGKGVRDPIQPPDPVPDGDGFLCPSDGQHLGRVGRRSFHCHLCRRLYVQGSDGWEVPQGDRRRQSLERIEVEKVLRRETSL